MTSRVATLRLQLVDAVSGPSANATKSLRGVDSALARLGKGGTPEIRRLTKQLEYLQKKAGSIQDFTGNRRGFKDLATQMGTARSNVARLEQALKSAAKPTAKIKADLESAKIALKSTTQAFRDQGAAVRQSERALQAYGIAGRRSISGAQQGIRNEIAKTIREMRRLDQESRKKPPTPPKLPPERRPPGGGSAAYEAAAVAGGYAGTKAIEAARVSVERGAELESMRNRIRNVSNNEDEVRSASEIAASASAKYPLTTQAMSLEDYAELRSLAVSKDHGKPIDVDKMRTNVMLMARTRAALASSGLEFTGEDAKALAQAIEGTGRTMDPKAQQNMLEAYVSGKQALGNALSANGIRDFVQNAKSSNFAQSDKSFFYTTFARLAQGNASRLGNEFAQTMSTLVGGHMTKAGAEWLVKQGMIEPGQFKNGGGGKFSIDGDIKQQDLLSSDPTAWAQEVLYPGMIKSGTISDDKVKARAEMLREQNPGADEHTLTERAIHGLIADELQKSGFRSTVTDNLAHAIANEFQTKKDVEQMKAAKGLGAADTIDQNPIASFNELTNSLQNFGSVLTNPSMAGAAATMHSLAGGISEITTSLQQWQKDHPGPAKFLGTAAPVAAGAGGLAATYLGFRAFMGGIFGNGRGATAALGEGGSAAATAGGGGLIRGALGFLSRAAVPLAAATTLGRGSLVNDPKVVGYTKSRLEEQRAKATQAAQVSGIEDDIARKTASWPIAAQQGIRGYINALITGGSEAEAKAQATGAQIKQALTVDGKLTIDVSQLEHALGLARQFAAVVRGEATGGSVATPSAPSSSPTVGGPRARGGPVKRGVTYPIGGSGIELFTPGADGFVTPGAGGGGAGPVIHVKQVNHFHGGKASDFDEAARVLDRQLNRAAQTAFSSIRYGDK